MQKMNRHTYMAGNGRLVHPREWFVVDFETINKYINEIMSKLKISNY